MSHQSLGRCKPARATTTTYAAAPLPPGAGCIVPMVPPRHRYADPRPLALLPGSDRGIRAQEAARFAIVLGAALAFALACVGMAVLLMEAGR